LNNVISLHILYNFSEDPECFTNIKLTFIQLFFLVRNVQVPNSAKSILFECTILIFLTGDVICMVFNILSQDSKFFSEVNINNSKSLSSIDNMSFKIDNSGIFLYASILSISELISIENISPKKNILFSKNLESIFLISSIILLSGTNIIELLQS
jgi:hypothetical protein